MVKLVKSLNLIRIKKGLFSLILSIKLSQKRHSYVVDWIKTCPFSPLSKKESTLKSCPLDEKAATKWELKKVFLFSPSCERQALSVHHNQIASCHNGAFLVQPGYLYPSCTVSPYARYAFCNLYSCSKSSLSLER